MSKREPIERPAKHRVYVATSWQNPFQAEVVAALRKEGHEVFDFRAPGGLPEWKTVDPNWKSWTPELFCRMLSEPAAFEAYQRDMKALRECDVVVGVTPFGVSTALEVGFAVGAGKLVVAYVPIVGKPELMLQMCHVVTSEFGAVLGWLRGYVKPRNLETENGRTDSRQGSRERPPVL